MIPKNNLPDFYNVVINTDSSNYLKAYDVLASFPHRPGLILTLKRPARNLRDQIQRKGFEIHEETHFIDGISKAIQHNLTTKNTLYLNSPENLKEITQAITKTAARMPLGEKFLIFDSPQIALRKKDIKTSLHFLNHITNQLRDHNFRGIFLTNNISENFKNNLANFADAFIQL